MMNSDFPRIITLLRKERGISQKNAAVDLGISQALLSHYEKGIRECGLEFLVKAADYYHVSCDYLLGRSPEPAGKTISYDEIPEHSTEASDVSDSTSGAIGKKLIINSTQVLYSLINKTESKAILNEATSYIMLALYRMFRIVFSANSKNDKHFFTVSETSAPALTSAAMSICEAKAVTAASECAAADGNDNVITAGSLSDEYSAYASSLLNIIKTSEEAVKAVSGKSE